MMADEEAAEIFHSMCDTPCSPDCMASGHYIGYHGLPAALGISKEDWGLMGPQARRILTDVLLQFVGKFVRANLHYGDGNANVLGPAGQFADIWRKIGPLRRALWDGVELTREGPDEICLDLIGHCLLTIDMIQQKVDRRGSG